MDGNLSETSIGQPTVLISEGKQHSLDIWAKASADEIFNTQDLTGEKLVTALMVKAQIQAILKYHFDDAIEREKRDLFMWRKHCNTDLNPVKFSTAAMMDIQTIQSPEWGDVLKSLEWSEAALHALGTHMVSAMHIERLNFADEYPENEAAQAYKLKNQGA